MKKEVFVMAIVKFETDRENDLIRIPEQYAPPTGYSVLPALR